MQADEAEACIDPVCHTTYVRWKFRIRERNNSQKRQGPPSEIQLQNCGMRKSRGVDPSLAPV